MMHLSEIGRLMEAWAPTSIAWEQDNVGLQIGSADMRVQNILVALEATSPVIDEARRLRVQLIIVHHPLIFRPLRRLNYRDRVGGLVQRIVQSGIALYAAHTNLDFTSDGVNHALAAAVGIHNPEFLVTDTRADKKVVVFVPPDHVDTVASAMNRAGGGTIGRYADCTFRSPGTGTFRPLAGANPYAGSVGSVERVKEERLEMIVPAPALDNVLTAIKGAHPYEEVALDVYDLANVSTLYGKGTVGMLERAVTLRSFLRLVRERLGAKGLRYTGNLQSPVRRVAFCGGSGTELLEAAIARKADVFLTSDIRYHTMQDAEGRIALVDAGHFETERPVVRRICAYLKGQEAIRRSGITVHMSRVMKNPVQYFLS